MGDTERPSANAKRQNADPKGFGVAQRLADLTLSLGEVPENLSQWGEPVWHPEYSEKLSNNKILLCCTDFPTLGFSGNNCPKIYVLMCLILVHVFVSVLWCISVVEFILIFTEGFS